MLGSSLFIHMKWYSTSGRCMGCVHQAEFHQLYEGTGEFLLVIAQRGHCTVILNELN